MTELVDRMQAAVPRMLADLETLVTCESPSADLAAVAASADVVARLGTERLGSAPEYVVVDGRTHLRWRLGDGPARVLVLGHHDTVWPVGSLATHPFVVEDGVLRGPGSFDMKTGLVMAFHALAMLPSASGVTLLVTGDEELGSPSSRELIEQEAAGCAAALVLEASAGGALKLERKGVSAYEIRIVGKRVACRARAGARSEREYRGGPSDPCRQQPWGCCSRDDGHADAPDVRYDAEHSACSRELPGRCSGADCRGAASGG